MNINSGMEDPQEQDIGNNEQNINNDITIGNAESKSTAKQTNSKESRNTENNIYIQDPINNEENTLNKEVVINEKNKFEVVSINTNNRGNVCTAEVANNKNISNIENNNTVEGYINNKENINDNREVLCKKNIKPGIVKVFDSIEEYIQSKGIASCEKEVNKTDDTRLVKNETDKEVKNENKVKDDDNTRNKRTIRAEEKARKEKTVKRVEEGRNEKKAMCNEEDGEEKMANSEEEAGKAQIAINDKEANNENRAKDEEEVRNEKIAKDEEEGKYEKDACKEDKVKPMIEENTYSQKVTKEGESASVGIIKDDLNAMDHNKTFPDVESVNNEAEDESASEGIIKDNLNAVDYDNTFSEVEKVNNEIKVESVSEGINKGNLNAKDHHNTFPEFESLNNEVAVVNYGKMEANNNSFRKDETFVDYDINLILGKYKLVKIENLNKLMKILNVGFCKRTAASGFFSSGTEAKISKETDVWIVEFSNAFKTIKNKFRLNHEFYCKTFDGRQVMAKVTLEDKDTIVMLQRARNQGDKDSKIVMKFNRKGFTQTTTVEGENISCIITFQRV